MGEESFPLGLLREQHVIDQPSTKWWEKSSVRETEKMGVTRVGCWSPGQKRSGEMALTRLLSFPHGLLDGRPDAELPGPDPGDAVAVGDGVQHDGVDVQAGCIVVLGKAECRGRLSYEKGQALNVIS